jgi:hypothetical protein
LIAKSLFKFKKWIFQVVTVEEDGGKLIIWTVLDSQHDTDSHLGKRAEDNKLPSVVVG